MRIDQTKAFHLQRPLGRASSGPPDVVIVCECGATDSIRAKGNTPSECIAQRFRHRGWRVDQDGKKALCKECQMTGKAKSLGVSTDALKAQAAAVRLLDEFFDVGRGLYQDDWSDMAVAQKVGLGESAIVCLRETVYGPLSVDPELLKVSKQLEEAIARWRTDTNELEQLIKGHADAFGKVVAELQCKVLEATKGRKAPNGAS